MKSAQPNGRSQDQRLGDMAAQTVPTNREDELWVLQNYDQPSMTLVTSPLTESNYLAWSTRVKIYLEAKDKIGFIDGSVKVPRDPTEFRKWKRADSMIKSWILNSISKEMTKLFIYCTTSKYLWDQLEERFRITRRLHIYQLQREIRNTHQGSDTVNSYFNKLYKLWNELNMLMPMPKCSCTGCTCELNKKLAERESSNRLFQFLMGLDHSFDNVRDQILNMDPLPNVNRAFNMVVGVERLKEVNQSYGKNPIEAAAMLSKASGSKNDAKGRFNGRKKDTGSKQDK